ncbi:hypothetical protein Glove_34g129 [Diversispora epigaea]|uniref:SWIM-type domain-containing protein n=1 Tax=Diversispora epigaea TaxID=1348612 RepID=A0A397JIU4_9GLOM|nr:hypothetical protein Glove_34g129 [Diversispora epigaea]
MLDITQWETNIKRHNDDNYNEGTREDNYEVTKVLLEDILSTIEISKIVEIWRYIILISDGSHQCTCNLLITHGYPCRHFYKILQTSPNAKWHIGLISNRWYKDDKIIYDLNTILQQAPISLCNINNLDNNFKNIFSLEHIKKVRGGEIFTPKLQELNNNWIKYRRAYDIMRKVIDLALATNSYEELIGMYQEFLNNKQEILTSQDESTSNKELDIAGIKNPIITARKGRPAGRAKNNRRKCHKCGQKGHNRTTSEINKERQIEEALQEPRPNPEIDKERRIERVPQELQPNHQQEEASQEELSRNQQRKVNRRSTTRTTTKSNRRSTTRTMTKSTRQLKEAPQEPRRN